MENYNILHYTVGLNKNRGGGMTKYIDDLISIQKDKNNVFILYPGKINFFNKKTRIKKEKKNGSVNVFSISNPLPLPMMFGLQNYDYIYRKTNINIWINFLKNNNIKIIHLHTLMGIYEEFIDAANELSIPILYTTHDYFGICPKQILYYDGKVCNKWNTCENCPKCNVYALSNVKSYLIHSKLFMLLRKTRVFKIAKSKEKSKINESKNNKINSKYDKNYYLKLRKKMFRMFHKITFFHFNSSLSYEIFHNAMPNIKGKIINIMHKNIEDNRKIRNYYSKKLRVTYLGPTVSYKGFDDIIFAIDNIYINNKDIELNIFSYTNCKRAYIKEHNYGYNYKDLPKIFDDTDILLAPSKCPETFGFTVIEAVSYGIPVIVSDLVGAKDIIVNGKNGYIVSNQKISNILKKLIENRDVLKEMNRNICKSKFKTFYNHCEEIDLLYKKIIKEETENI